MIDGSRGLMKGVRVWCMFMLCLMKICSGLLFADQTCGWEEKYSYRILGTPRLEEHLIKYDLKLARKACEERASFRKVGGGKVVAAKFPVK